MTLTELKKSKASGARPHRLPHTGFLTQPLEPFFPGSGSGRQLWASLKSRLDQGSCCCKDGRGRCDFFFPSQSSHPALGEKLIYPSVNGW